MKKFRLGFEEGYFNRIADQVKREQSFFDHYKKNMEALGMDPFKYHSYDELEKYVIETLVKSIPDVPGWIDDREVLKMAKKEWILLDIMELRMKFQHLQLYVPGALDTFKESCVKYTTDAEVIERCERILALEKEMAFLGVVPHKISQALAGLGYNNFFKTFNEEYIKGVITTEKQPEPC